MRAARTDANHAALLKVLREFGWLAFDTHIVPGFADAVIYRPSHSMLLAEFKAGEKAKLKSSQEALRRDGWPWVRFDSVDDVEAFTVNPTPPRMRG